MGPTWGRQDPDGPHVGPMNFAIQDVDKRDTSENWLVKLNHMTSITWVDIKVVYSGMSFHEKRNRYIIHTHI